jgi:outer membrane protein assembly factor BamD (BamD/ComL family)
MSVSGISSSSLFDTAGVQSIFQQFQQTFQQLGQDLQSGNLSAAQSDFAALQNLGAQNSTTASQSNSPIAQAFSQLAKDLQSGNLSAAQQDFATIQQDFQNQSAQGQSQSVHGHHHHHGSGSGSSEISQLLGELGTALQSGDLSTAQQAYSSLVQQFQQSSPSGGAQTETASPSSSGGVSISA